MELKVSSFLSPGRERSRLVRERSLRVSHINVCVRVCFLSTGRKRSRRVRERSLSASHVNDLLHQLVRL